MFFLPQQARRFVYEFAKLEKAPHIHICKRATAVMKDDIANGQVGKFISYLISDFIKANNNQ